MPTAVKDTGLIYANDPDLTISGNVLANDTAGSILRFIDGVRIGPKGQTSVTVDGDYGVFTFQPYGSYTYKLNAGVIPPADGFTDKVNYKISDGSGTTDYDSLVITIKPAITSVRPVAVDDFATVVNNQAVGNVLSNDYDPDGGAVHVSRAGGENTATANPNDFILKFIQPGSGTTVVEGKFGFLAIDRDGAFTYFKNAGDPDTLALNGASAVDTFQYRIYDDEFGQGPANNLTTDIGLLHINL